MTKFISHKKVYRKKRWYRKIWKKKRKIIKIIKTRGNSFPYRSDYFFYFYISYIYYLWICVCTAVSSVKDSAFECVVFLILFVVLLYFPFIFALSHGAEDFVGIFLIYIFLQFIIMIIHCKVRRRWSLLFLKMAFYLNIDWFLTFFFNR